MNMYIYIYIIYIDQILLNNTIQKRCDRTQGKIDLRNESGRPMKVKVVGEVSEK